MSNLRERSVVYLGFGDGVNFRMSQQLFNHIRIKVHGVPVQHVNVWISGDDAALTPPAQKRAAIQPGMTPEFGH